MSGTGRHWNSKELVLLGLWLWEQGEYGHAMLCIHAPNWGLKIGEQLKLQWWHVFDCKAGKPLDSVRMKYNQSGLRPIRNVVKSNLEKAFKTLNITDEDTPLYVNAKTGKPLTSSTLNRELQRFAKLFLEDMKRLTGLELPLREIKTNAFEIAWAKDVTRDNNYVKEIYPVLSRFMGHRTVRDTIELLEEEDALPNSVEIRFDLIEDNTALNNEGIIADKAKLSKFVERNLYLGIEE